MAPRSLFGGKGPVLGKAVHMLLNQVPENSTIGNCLREDLFWHTLLYFHGRNDAFDFTTSNRTNAMKIIKFKTNMNCEGCVAGVAPFLDGSENISSWQVDTENPDKVLSVAGEQIEPGQIKVLVQKAGFEAEVIRVQGIGGVDL